MSVTAEIETRYRSNVITVPIQSVTTRLPSKKKELAPTGGVMTAHAAGKPEAATKEGDKKEKPIEVVFSLQGGAARMVPVRRGISDDAYVEIVEGLGDGAEVISGGYKAINRDLEDGKPVKVGPPEEKKEKEEEK